MTWGQLRFQLQTAFAGVADDLLDEWLNGRYEHVLEMSEWTGVQRTATLQTTAAYQSTTDSATFTVGSADVAGVGTAWTSGATLGMKLYRPGDTALYTVTVWNSATSIALDRPYEGAGADLAGVVYSGAYVLMQNVYAVPADVRAVTRLLDPATGRPMARHSKGELDLVGPRTRVGNPAGWALVDDTDEAAGSVVHQIELYPAPVSARGIPVEYLHAAMGFDGSATGSGPMPWVSNSVLLYGAKADGYAYLAGKTDAPGEKATYLALAKMAEAKFGEALERLLRVEHQQRRPIQALKMAGRFTRHRLARAGRNARGHVAGVDADQSTWSTLNPDSWGQMKP